MKLKNSFRMQFAFVFVALMASCILISILVSNLLLKAYSRGRQMNYLESSFEEINDTLGGLKVILPSEMKLELDRISSNNNYAICLFDEEGNIAVYSSEGQDERLVESLASYIVNGTDETAKSCEIVKEEKKYTIYKADDDYINTTSFDLVGKLDNNIYCLIKVNYAGIERASRVANNFYAYVGIAIIFVEALLIIVFLGKFTKPIENMNEVAKKMTELDFEAKAEVNSDNEIGQLAKSLNTLSETLEEKILELKTANIELQSDLKKREEIDEMRRDFLGNVSHELKTPIAIIQGYAEGLKLNVNDDPESRDFYCDVIMDEAAKMNTMVKKLLSLNKLEYGRDQLEITRFNITEMIKGVLSASEILSGDKKVEVLFDDSKVHYVYADEYMAEEVITNYISNAYHYVSGANRIEIKFSEGEEGLRVSVFNTGSHISDDDIDKIWDKFYKADKARSRQYGGSGIGLSIVKAIASLHHKQCGVMNRDDGVEFWVEFDDKGTE